MPRNKTGSISTARTPCESVPVVVGRCPDARARDPDDHCPIMRLVTGMLLLGGTLCVGEEFEHEFVTPRGRVTVNATTTPSLRTAPEQRYLVVGGSQCRQGASTRCICTLEQLVSAFESASTNARRVTRIRMCLGSSLALDAPINITGKAFALTCLRPNQCSVQGVNTNLFVGAPLTARFASVSLLSGKAEKGGALHLTGGQTRITNVELSGNQASVTGGAIYLEGPDTELSYRRAVFRNNFGGTGGAISVAKGAQVRTFASSYQSNGAATVGGAVYNDGGYVKLVDSVFSENYATTGTGNTLYTTVTNETTTRSETECGVIIRVTFCGGKDGIVTEGAATSNCRQKGLFNVDPRCRFLGTGP